jgi:hypothetical protein
LTAADLREALERTGVLFTQYEDDPGHIPHFWRSAILGLCDALDAAPTDVADLLRQERVAHASTKDELAKARAEADALLARVASAEDAKSKAESDRLVAVHLVTEAAPRMRTLNNAMSPGWLARAAALLGE